MIAIDPALAKQREIVRGALDHVRYHSDDGYTKRTVEESYVAMLAERDELARALEMLLTALGTLPSDSNTGKEPQ